jgi:hypothetical protein
MKALAVKGLTQINDANDPVQELNLKGEISVIEFEKEELVKKCYDFIGTNIVEAVHLPNFGVTMWLDEEGKLKNNVLPNLDGTLLFMRQFMVQDVIMGHVVFTSDKTDDEGWALGLNDAELEKLKEEILKMQSKRPDTAFATDVLNSEPKRG